MSLYAFKIGNLIYAKRKKRQEMAGFTISIIGSNLFFVVPADILPFRSCKKHSNRPIGAVTSFGISYIYKNTGRHLLAWFPVAWLRKQDKL